MRGLVLLVLAVAFIGAHAQLTCPPGYDCSGMCDAISFANANATGGNASIPFTNMSSLALPCPTGFLCLQDQEPFRCPRKYYCPDATTKIECPSGHFCNKGSSAPKKCPKGAVCAAGSWKYIHVLAIFLIVATHGVIVLLYFAITRGSNRLKPDIELTDIGNAETHKDTLNFWFQDLQVKIKTGNFISKLWGSEKLILQGVSGRFDAGRVAAVMGPSGAGKSTFVNVLLGKINKSGGTIMVNGVESSTINLKTSVGYVPQEDVMLREGVTVRDILLHSATTRLPGTWTKAQLEAKVEDTLKVLKLESVQNNFIGDEITRGLSGGERKRVNIGIELVADPIALVCDEPTSGLDTTSAYDIMYFLKMIARELNMTVVVVLHQPRHEIFELCDDLLLLGKGGYTTYIGTTDEARGYFTTVGFPCPDHVNPADHFIDVVSGKVDSAVAGGATNSLEYLVKAWQQNKGSFATEKQDSSPVPKPEYAPMLRQFIACVKRSFTQLFRDVSGRLVDNFLHFLAGAIIALGFVSQEMFIPPIPRAYLPLCPPSISKEFCWYPEVANISRMPIYTTIAIGLAAATIGVRSFYNERVVYWRETSSGTNTVMYFLAKNFVDLFPILFYALTFTCAFVTVTVPAGSFGGYFAMIILYEFCLYPVGYICGSLSDTNPSVLAVIVALLSGLGTQAIGVPFMWSRWASEGLVVNELDYDWWPDDIKPLVKDYVIYWKYKVGTFGTCVIALILIGLGLRLLAYILMRLAKRDKQR